jgi:hypothetical protein
MFEKRRSSDSMIWGCTSRSQSIPMSWYPMTVSTVMAAISLALVTPYVEELARWLCIHSHYTLVH